MSRSRPVDSFRYLIFYPTAFGDKVMSNMKVYILRVTWGGGVWTCILCESCFWVPNGPSIVSTWSIWQVTTNSNRFPPSSSTIEVGMVEKVVEISILDQPISATFQRFGPRSSTWSAGIDPHLSVVISIPDRGGGWSLSLDDFAAMLESDGSVEP